MNVIAQLEFRLTYYGLIWFGLVGFYAMSTIVGYLMSNHLYTYVSNICQHILSVKWSNDWIFLFLTIQFSMTQQR